jgi:hypothetical protein
MQMLGTGKSHFLDHLYQKLGSVSLSGKYVFNLNVRYMLIHI